MADRPMRSIVPILPVHDLRRAMDYYRRLGFTAQAYQNGDGYAFLDRDGLEIHLTASELLVENQNPCGVYFYLNQGTAAALEAEFRAAGISIISALAPRFGEHLLSV